jgi:hypothetical protein
VERAARILARKAMTLSFKISVPVHRHIMKLLVTPGRHTNVKDALVAIAL